jgi:cobalt/nickel transport protein
MVERTGDEAVNGQNMLLLGLAAVIALAPLLVVTGSFTGTDEQAKSMIGQVRPDYRPWFESLWQPSEAMETLLFALQAALGASFIGFYFGLLVAKKWPKAGK